MRMGGVACPRAGEVAAGLSLTMEFEHLALSTHPDMAQTPHAR
jgi:hypothetical protein